ncbi:hypothetical protein SDJN02_26886, partial [Cucurbita argyrosperma subsp. argyrosperma]
MVKGAEIETKLTADKVPWGLHFFTKRKNCFDFSVRPEAFWRNELNSKRNRRESNNSYKPINPWDVSQEAEKRKSQATQMKKKKFPLGMCIKTVYMQGNFTKITKRRTETRTKGHTPVLLLITLMISEYDWDVACGGLFLGLIPYCQPLPKQLDFQI